MVAGAGRSSITSAYDAPTALPQRPYRRRMAAPGTPAATAPTQRRPIKYPRREIVNAILYTLRTGAAWRMLPHDFPPYRIVFHYYRIWRKEGV